MKPVSKYIYIAKAKASLSRTNESIFNVYPTCFQQEFTIEKPHLKAVNFYVANFIGQILESGQIRDPRMVINTMNWNTGMYFLRLENSGQIFKLIKK